MENVFSQVLASQAPWTALSLFMVFWVLKTTGDREKKSEEREKNYQCLLDKFAEKFNILEDVKEDVKEIRSKLNK